MASGAGGVASAAVDAPIPETRIVKSDKSPAAFPLNPDHLKVLVIDDEATILTVTCLMLKRLGICPRGVTSGEEAVEVVRREAGEIELLFLDILLADTTGFKVYSEVRKFREELPIVFFSGYSVQRELGETLRRDPLTRFMAKPFGMAELESVLLDP